MNPPRKTPYLIRAARCLRLLLHFIWLGLGAALIYPCVGVDQRLRLRQRWSHQILKILGVHLEANTTSVPRGSLIVANHISWLDIFAIHAFRPVSFIAKAEIRGWPFIGWLSEHNGTVFLRRGSRGHARIINEEIDALLNTGTDAALFPEGTTTDGTHLLGFHAALLQPAVETGRPILPVALSYHDENGDLSLAPSFAGSVTLPQCFLSILACRALTVRVHAAAPIDTTAMTRREASLCARTAIEAILSTNRGFRPSNNRPETLPDPQGG